MRPASLAAGSTRQRRRPAWGFEVRTLHITHLKEPACQGSTKTFCMPFSNRPPTQFCPVYHRQTSTFYTLGSVSPLLHLLHLLPRVCWNRHACMVAESLLCGQHCLLCMHSLVLLAQTSNSATLHSSLHHPLCASCCGAWVAMYRRLGHEHTPGHSHRCSGGAGE
jgi:hypothetical protein